MLIASSIQLSLRSMRANKVRTALTVLGIMIGISAVIIVYSAGEGIRSLIMGQVESFGTDILETEIKIPSNKKGIAADSQSGSAIAQGVQITTLKLKDMEAVDKLANIKESYSGLQGQAQVSYQNEMNKFLLLGLSANYINIDQAKIEKGRFFTDAEDKSHEQLAVLGPKVASKLFGDSDPIDKMIKVQSKKFRVIGVFKAKGATLGFDYDNIVYLPIRTLQKKLLGIDHIYYMVNQLKDVSLAYDTKAEVEEIIRANHEITDPVKDDFRVVTMDEMMKTLGTITGAITLLLLAIVAISLVVGGVGIMNIMYVAVTERTAEIGLRKAVGAKHQDIMWQFVIEAIIVTLAGGVAGIIFGVVISYLIFLGANSYGLDWKFLLPWQGFAVAMGFSTAFGVFFGVFPARKAARLDPIQALRKE